MSAERPDLAEALSILEHYVEQSDFDGSCWTDEDDDNPVTHREYFEVVRRKLAALEAYVADSDQIIKDRERLDWMQEQSDRHAGLWHCEYLGAGKGYRLMQCSSGDALGVREAIDSAIEAQRQGSEG